MLTKKYLNISELTKQVMKDIKNKKILDKNGKLPSEYELMSKYSTSRYSVRQTLKILSEAGIIRQKQGVGTFIRPENKNEVINLQENQKIHKMMNPNYLISNIPIGKRKLHIYEAEFLPKNKVLPSNLKIVEVNNLKMLNDKPYFTEKIYFLEDIIDNVPNINLYESVFNFSKEDKHLNIGIIDKYISSSLLSKEDATLLKLDIEEPALLLRKDIFLKTGELLCFSKEIYNYNDVEFYISNSY